MEDKHKNRYLLRIHPSDVQSLVSREQEFQVWSAAATEGLAPQITYMDVAYRFVIAEYVDCVPYDGSLAHQQIVQKTLDHFHSLHLDQMASMPLASKINFYHQSWGEQRISEQAHMADVLKLAAQSAAILESQPLEQGLCHMDLNHDHILMTEQGCLLIDFEYAHKTYRIFDWVSLLWTDKMNAVGQDYLREAKLLDTPVNDAAQAYLLSLCWLWFVHMYHVRKDKAYYQQQKELYVRLKILKEQLNLK